jgi:hypothetical protein
MKRTYEKKNRTEPMAKPGQPSTEAPTEVLVESVLNTGRGRRSTGLSTPAPESGARPYQVIKLGIDVHLDRYVVVRQIDGGAPQPPQRFSPAQFLDWAKKQTTLAQRVYSCYVSVKRGAQRVALSIIFAAG